MQFPSDGDELSVTLCIRPNGLSVKHHLIIFVIWLQPDALHDLSRLMMEEFRRLAFRVSETEVARARNQVAMVSKSIH